MVNIVPKKKRIFSLMAKKVK